MADRYAYCLVLNIASMLRNHRKVEASVHVLDTTTNVGFFQWLVWLMHVLISI